ncbi:MAG: tryptophan synthase subunit alpha [Polyangiaceae bacterium]|nr:tryptophan synthase subunit alpha [Polyangiaceae bacterium]
MTHIVLGYPSFDDSMRIIEEMVQAGVELIELQIPFSEPMADGPVILHANQEALNRGSLVERCFEFAREASRRVDIPLLFMTYFNVIFKKGQAEFVQHAKEAGITGAIIPDLPPEEGQELFAEMAKQHIDPIFIYSPSTSDDRLAEISKMARGFVYCVARKGVTGKTTEFSHDLGEYLGRVRSATELPLAVGFGVQQRKDVAYLEGRADIAVVGSQTIRVIDSEGVSAVRPFLEGLR